MFYRIALAVVIAFVLAIGYLGYLFGVVSGWWNPLVRPAGVSPTAHYVFIWESAGWFDCSVDHQENVNVCKAWDATGRLCASGRFRLKGEGRAATEAELKPSALGPTELDGSTRTIYLFGPDRLILGKELVQVDAK